MTTLIFTFVALVLGLAVCILWIKVNRPPKEDPRLSRGLQLLQNKIAVLADLSDRTDRQCEQMIALIEERAKLLQSKIMQAQDTMTKIEQSMAKSLDVARIFQDKIPHEEIIERQNTAKYVQAAKLAHQGLSIEAIMTEVDLPRSEVEFIAKVNRDELMFAEELLPDWAKDAVTSSVEMDGVHSGVSNEALPSVALNGMRTGWDSDANSELTGIGADPLRANRDQRLTAVFAPNSVDLTEMQKITDNFKSSVREVEEEERRQLERERLAEERRRAFEAQQKQFVDSAKKATKEFISVAGEVAKQGVRGASDFAKPVVRGASEMAKQGVRGASEMTKPIVRGASEILHDVGDAAKPIVRKVQFPRIDKM